MVVVPFGNAFPEGTPLRVIVTGEQLSVAVADPSSASVTSLLQLVAPSPVATATPAGALIPRGVVSGTRTRRGRVGRIPARVGSCVGNRRGPLREEVPRRDTGPRYRHARAVVARDGAAQGRVAHELAAARGSRPSRSVHRGRSRDGGILTVM